MAGRDLYYRREQHHQGKMLDKGRRNDSGWSASVWVLAFVAAGIIGAGGYYLNWYMGESSRLTMELEALQIKSNLQEKRIHDDAVAASSNAEVQQRDLNRCQTKADAMERVTQSTKADLLQTEEQLRESQSNLEAARNSQGVTQAAESSCRQELNAATSQLNSCQAELTSASGELSSCQTNQESLSEQVANCRIEGEQLKATFQAAEPAKAEAEQQLQVCQAGLQAKEQVAADLLHANQKVAELQARLDSLTETGTAASGGQQEVAVVGELSGAPKSSEADPDHTTTVELRQGPLLAVEGDEAGADSTGMEAMKAALSGAKWHAECSDSPLTLSGAPPCIEFGEGLSDDFANSKAKHLRASCESNCLYSQSHPISVAYFWNAEAFCYEKVGVGHQCLSSGYEHDEFMKWLGSLQTAAADVAADTAAQPGEEGSQMAWRPVGALEGEEADGAAAELPTDDLPAELQREDPEDENMQQIQKEEALGVDEDTLHEVAAFGSVDPNAGSTENVEGWDQEARDKAVTREELPAELEREDPEDEDHGQVEQEAALGVDEETLDEVAAFGSVEQNPDPAENVEGWDQVAEDKADTTEDMPAPPPHEEPEAAVEQKDGALGVDEETLDEVAAFGSVEVNAGPSDDKVEGWDQEAEDVLEQESQPDLERRRKSKSRKEGAVESPKWSRDPGEEAEQGDKPSDIPRIIMPDPAALKKSSRKRSKRLFGSHRGEA